MTKNKTTDNWIDYVLNVARTAQSVDIDSVIIEPTVVRAINDSKTVVIFHDEKVPELSIGSIAMTRIGTFLDRYGIISSGENPGFEAVKDDRGDYIRSVIMKNDDTTIEYRCANPETIQAPKKINDAVEYAVIMPLKSSSVLKSAHSAMDSGVVEIVSDEDGVKFEVLDIVNSSFTHKFADKAVNVKDEDADAFFTHKYPLKNLLSVLHGGKDSTLLEIGEKGIITSQVNGLNILILPQV